MKTSLKIGVIAGLLSVVLAVTAIYATIQGTVAVSVVDSTNSTRYYNVPGDNTSGMWVNVKNASITVIQPTGTSLHAVLDSGSTTTVTQTTAANLNATVVGNNGVNSAAPGTTNMNVNTVLANAANPALTEGYAGMASADLHGNLRIRQSQISTAITSTGGAGVLEVVPISGSKSIKVYSWILDTTSGGIVDVNWVYGTGTNCAVGQTNITNLVTLTVTHEYIVIGPSVMPWFVVPASNALCLKTSASATVYSTLGYIQE